MAKLLSLNINLDNIDMKRVFKGKKGSYLNIRLVLNEQVDAYGNIGFLVQETTAEEYKQGIKLPICGSVKERLQQNKERLPDNNEPTTRPKPIPNVSDVPYGYKQDSFINDLPF